MIRSSDPRARRAVLFSTWNNCSYRTLVQVFQMFHASDSVDSAAPLLVTRPPRYARPQFRIKTYPLLQPRHMAARWRLEAVPFAESIFLDNRSPPAHIARVPRPVTSSGSSAFLDPLAGFGKRVNRFPTLEFPPSAFPTREGYWQPRPTTTLHSARAPQANRLEGSPLLFSYRTPRSTIINVTTSGRVPPQGLLRVSNSPEVVDVHHEKHIGGALNLVAAGVRTGQNGVSRVPWTVQVGKSNGYPTGVYGCFL